MQYLEIKEQLHVKLLENLGSILPAAIILWKPLRRRGYYRHNVLDHMKFVQPPGWVWDLSMEEWKLLSWFLPHTDNFS